VSRMSYRRSSKSRVVLAALLAASLTVVTLDFREGSGGPLRKVQDQALSLLSPMQAGVTHVLAPAGDFLHSVGQIPSLQSQNARLRRQVANLRAQENRVPEVLRENQQALGLLREKSWVTGRALGARVISQGPSNQEWTVFLDKGAVDGVQQDMAVIAETGLVGRVTLVSANSAKVLLTIDPQHSVGARLTSSGDVGVLSGKGQADLALDLIGVTTTVTSGETVVTSGYDKGIYPAGIPIGRVRSTRKSPDGLSQSASVQPFVDFNKLGLVEILLDTHSIKLPGQ
jgi:rod shape-determining protein MreC